MQPPKKNSNFKKSPAGDRSNSRPFKQRSNNFNKGSNRDKDRNYKKFQDWKRVKSDTPSPQLLKKLLIAIKGSKFKANSIDDDSLNEETLLLPQEAEIVLENEKKIWRAKELSKPNLISLLSLEILYAKSFYKASFDKDSFYDWIVANQGFFLENKLFKTFFNKATKLVSAVEKDTGLVEEISPYLIGWQWDRLSMIKQLILKLAWSEIKLHTQDVSNILNNAINQAKWFGEEKDYAFINSILDKFISQNHLWGNDQQK